jgi:Ala-tRNA(Pro) deacylase
MRTVDYLAAQNVPFDSLLHPPAYGASKRARSLGVAGRDVAKAVLLVGPEGYLLAVLPTTHEIDLALLSRALGGPLRLARVAEAARLFFDCEWGAVSAFGNLYGLPILLDTSLPPCAFVVFEAGSHFHDVRLFCEDFERLSGALRLAFARPIAQDQAQVAGEADASYSGLVS